MSVKHVLLTTCVLFAAAPSVHAQSRAADVGAPADLFSSPKFETRAATDRPPVRSGESAPLVVPRTAGAGATGPSAPWQLNRPKPAADVASGGPAGDGIDLSALRYYAAQNDLARVSAEIKQIRSRHPDWQPPDDLFTDAGGSADEQPLWDLYAKGDIAGVHDGIAAIQHDKPDWQPSLDLRSKLAEAEARRAWIEASDAKRWDDVVNLAANNTPLLICANIDLLWRTAEALASTGDEDKSLSAYNYILSNCRDPQERLATVQKASLVLKTPGDLDTLMRQGRTGADGRSEFEPVRVALVRQKVGSAVQAGSTPAVQDIEAIKADWAKSRDVDDADMLAWAALAAKQPAEAESWFRNAVSVSDTPKRSEGLALALRDEKHLPEAEKVLLPRTGSDPASAKLLIEIVSASLLDASAPAPGAEVLAAFTTAIETAKSWDGAQAYGWWLYKAGQTATATQWFEKSNGWQANESAIVGLLVSAKRQKHEVAFRDLVQRYASVYPKVGQLAAVMRWHGAGDHARPRASFGRPSTGPALVASRSEHRRLHVAASGEGGWDRDADAIVQTYQNGNYGQALQMLDSRRQRGSEPTGLTVIRGWTQYHNGDWEGAKQTFASLHDKADDKSREGLRVIEDSYSLNTFKR